MPPVGIGRADSAFALHGVIKRVQVLRLLKFRIGLFQHNPRLPLPLAKRHIPASQASDLATLAHRLGRVRTAILHLTVGCIKLILDLIYFWAHTIWNER